MRLALIAAAIVRGNAALRAGLAMPSVLIHDEAQCAAGAGDCDDRHDLSGRLLPMYFTEPEFPPGRDPALIYVTALGLRVLPFTEAGARTPTALVAVLDLVLMFFAARTIFRNTWLAVLAAGMLALTPIHFIRGRLLLSPLYSIPFVLAWLWSLGRFEQQPSSRRFVATCVWLALDARISPPSLMMPLYL
jgi:hypothetical protein